jgi:hypothetical protein
MRQVLSAIFAIFLFSSGVAFAQSRLSRSADAAGQPADPTVSAWSAEKIERPETRGLDFERLEEPLQLPLTRPDPELLAQKYVASIRIVPAKGQRPSLATTESLKLMLGRHLLLDPRHHQPYIPPETPPLLLANQFERMAGEIPEDRLPAKDHLEFFTSKEIDKGFLMVFTGSDQYREICILAPTAEEAEARAEAFLALIDLGMIRPFQKAFWDRREPVLQAWRENQKALQLKEEQYAEVKAAYDATDDFPADIRSMLRVQQLQLEIDRAGVQARVDTCDRLLKDANGETRRSIEQAKILAEIELASFVARQAKADQFISKLDEKSQLAKKLASIDSERRTIVSETNNFERNLASIEQRLNYFQRPTIVDSKILIKPVEWTK